MPRAPGLHAALAPLDTTARVAAAAGRLRQAISLGLIGPGEQLPAEGELAQQLSVSTMTLRQTLAILRQEGLLETRRGRAGGTFVRSAGAGAEVGVGAAPADGPPLDALRDLGDEWGAVAGAAAALAAQRASAAEVERLAACAAGFDPDGDVLARRRGDWRFHMQLAAASQSVRLSRAEREVQGELADLLWVAGDPVRRARDTARAHRSILAAVRARDPARARRRAQEHVRAELAAIAGRAGGGGDAGDGAPGGAQRAEAVLATLETALEGVFARLARTRMALLARERPHADFRLRRSALQGLRPLLVSHLDEVVSGTGVIVAPGVADVPRWLEWWWRADPGGPPRQLIVDLHPDSANFYDYERAEWFDAPRRTGERSMTGAYVDFGGTEQHIVTISLPAYGEDGTFLGVVAADVRVAAFEPLLLGALRAAGPRAALVDQDERVILSTDPDALCGERLAVDGGRAVRRAGLPWAVVVR